MSDVWAAVRALPDLGQVSVDRRTVLSVLRAVGTEVHAQRWPGAPKTKVRGLYRVSLEAVR